MSAAWWLVALVGAATIAIKGAGPVLLGGKPLPPRIGRIIGLLAPALLAALVAISTFGGDRAHVQDGRAGGVEGDEPVERAVDDGPQRRDVHAVALGAERQLARCAPAQLQDELPGTRADRERFARRGGQSALPSSIAKTKRIEQGGGTAGFVRDRSLVERNGPCNGLRGLSRNRPGENEQTSEPWQACRHRSADCLPV